MKPASIQRTLVEQVAAFLSALPHKQSGLPSQADCDNAQFTKAARDRIRV